MVLGQGFIEHSQDKWGWVSFLNNFRSGGSDSHNFVLYITTTGRRWVDFLYNFQILSGWTLSSVNLSWWEAGDLVACSFSISFFSSWCRWRPSGLFTMSFPHQPMFLWALLLFLAIPEQGQTFDDFHDGIAILNFFTLFLHHHPSLVCWCDQRRLLFYCIGGMGGRRKYLPQILI